MLVAVAASGPSMTPDVARMLEAAGVRTIAVNTTHRLVPWAWALYAADAEWWAHEANADAHRFAGRRLSCQPVLGIELIRNVGTVGWCDDPMAVHTYGNSGAQALQLAVKLGGARKVLLCGFDFTRRTAAHWHGEHPPGLRSTSEELFAIWRGRMGALAEPLLARGVDVVNCSPGSALQVFRHGSLEDEIGCQGAKSAA